MGEIYERLPRESAKAFEAFSVYLGIGPKRTVVETAKRCRKSVSLLSRWSRKFDWEGRARAHGGHLARVEHKAAEAVALAAGTDWGFRQLKHRESEWELRGELIEASREVLKKFRDGSRGATLGDVARALDLASKLGRLASGLDVEKQPEDRKEDVNVLVAIEVVLDKIYGAEGGNAEKLKTETLKGMVVEVEGTSNIQHSTLNIERPMAGPAKAGTPNEEGGER